jgi:type II restriction/modification system DNA methylase subunit YeeA
MDFTRKGYLAKFVDWCQQHITGDEKGEAQIFLDRFFQAFQHGGVKEAGATLEMRVKNNDTGGTSFADLVWKPIVLVEMKRRGEDLSRHYRQAFDYWTRLVPGRPRYVVLCNFDEFWIYDFETQLDSPVDKLSLTDLPDRYGPLAFLYSTNNRPTFENNREKVTREAADRLALVFKMLLVRKVDRTLAQRFILQMLVAQFSEDIGLLREYFVTQLLEDCKNPKDRYDLLGGLFAAMNTKDGVRGGRYQGVDYFNGGLFAEPARIELEAEELSQLCAAAKSNWSQVSPEIFGTIFQHSVDEEERHAFGAHFTSAVDIMKIVGPTIVEPWRALIEEAKSIKRLEELHHRLATFSVLDPACGSGNFLYMAYREMRRLEKRIFDRMLESAAQARSFPWWALSPRPSSTASTSFRWPSS